jgi:hypothetical protein
MSTFVIRIVTRAAGDFHGTVRHVSSGEEVVFSSPSQLMAFIEEMNAVSSVGETCKPLLESPPAPDQSHGPKSPTDARRIHLEVDAEQRGKAR